ncbi:ClpP/crotonase-like domain-containing protein [Kalaharituber pfeilii]|nr:ClpP/crotonase-like domain-containing protein [Kalaharituber pfeilii]
MSPSSPKFTFITPPPPTTSIFLSFPTPRVLLVTINAPEKMNCLNTRAHYELDRVWRWYDEEPSLRCAIITGAPPKAGGRKAFCAGQDLKEWRENREKGGEIVRHPPGGFGGLSRRMGKKPVVAAVDGICMGGGFEMICNVDLTLSAQTSVFSFPELTAGVIPFAGALPRLLYNLGLPRATELILTGRRLTAKEALDWSLINKVVGEGEDVVKEAIRWAEKISTEMSPDAVVVARRGLRMGWTGMGVEQATVEVEEGAGAGRIELERGENIKEGLRAFAEKRKPTWVDSKL